MQGRTSHPRTSLRVQGPLGHSFSSLLGPPRFCANPDSLRPRTRACHLSVKSLLGQPQGALPKRPCGGLAGPSSARPSLRAAPLSAVAPVKEEGAASSSAPSSLGADKALRTQAEEFLMALEGTTVEDKDREGEGREDRWRENQATDQMKEQLQALQAKVR